MCLIKYIKNPAPDIISIRLTNSLNKKHVLLNLAIMFRQELHKSNAKYFDEDCKLKAVYNL